MKNIKYNNLIKTKSMPKGKVESKLNKLQGVGYKCKYNYRYKTK